MNLLETCISATKLKNMAAFHDLNPIATALADFCRKLSKKQLATVEPKLREVISVMKDLKAKRRVDAVLLEKLESVIDAGLRSAAQTPKSKRKKKDEEFVVVNKVWSLTPNRLTEHQKERLKERRDDIPALYNGLSQSQDSVSLVAWTPKELVALAKPAQNKDKQDENVPPNGTDRPPKAPNSTESITASDGEIATEAERAEPKVSTSEDKDEEKKKRMERELSRIHIDAKVNSVILSERTRRVRTSLPSVSPIVKKKAKEISTPKEDFEGPAQNKSSAEDRETAEAEVNNERLEENTLKEPVSSGETSEVPPKENLPGYSEESMEETESESILLSSKEKVDMEVAEEVKTEATEPEAAPETKENNDKVEHEAEMNVSSCSDRSLSPIPCHGKSYMSALVFETTAESILTSPQMNVERSQEFLNDTLNISPIAADSNPFEVAGARPKAIEMPATPVAESKCSSPAPSATPSSSGHPMKALKLTQISTPIQSAQSPISSKFKPQLTGRGAQLLQLINNKNQQKALNDSIQASAAASSPSISRLQTAPIRDIVSTPDPRPIQPLNTSRLELLQFSRDLPSPHESPRFSILKRKAQNEDDDDSFALPASKRKRVSFNFPLSETVEFVTRDDEYAATAVGGDENVSSSSRLSFLSNCSPAMRVRNKLKRKKRNEVIKGIVPLAPAAGSDDGGIKTLAASDDVVSIEQITEYLENENSSHHEERLLEPKEPMEGGSDVDRSPPGASSDAPRTLSSFSDDELFKHLFAKHNLGEIVRQRDKLLPNASIDPQSARGLSSKLSAVMSLDAAVRTSVLEELAEQHSAAFLDHAVTENLCSTVCERLLSTSTNGALDYMATKFSNDEEFRSSWLSRVPSKLFADPALVIDRDAVPGQPAPQEIIKLASSIFEQFSFNSDQFEAVLALYLQNRKRKSSSEPE